MPTPESMRRAGRALVLLLGLATFLSLPGPSAHADDAADIRGVIEAQLDAFRRDAGAEAFSYASPDIRRKFGDAATFMNMVRSGYPQVYRPQVVEFRDLGELRGQPTQKVFFIGPDGRGAMARYIMERQPDGRWLIDGVMIEKLPEQMT